MRNWRQVTKRMAPGPEETVSEQGWEGRSSWYLPVTSSSHHPGPRRGKAAVELKAAGGWGGQTVPAGWALASLPGEMNAAIHRVGSLWAFTSRSLQNNNNKNPIEAPFSSDHVFPEFFLEIRGCVVHTRPQEAGLFSPPYNSWEAAFRNVTTDQAALQEPSPTEFLAELLHKTFKSHLAGFTLDHISGCLLSMGPQIPVF